MGLAWLIAALLAGCGEPVSDYTEDACSVPTLDTLFAGEVPPDPNDALFAAPECLLGEYDVIIVLGCPTDEDGTPSECQTQRVDLALALSAIGLGDQFITTGGAVQNEFVEAESMRALLVERGVDPDAIRVEDRAEHTDENLYYSSRIMEDEGWTRALVISEPGHLIYVATCDANCCVALGRLTPMSYDAAGAGVITAAAYVLYPDAEQVSDEECSHIQGLLMCVNLGTRLACADDFQLE